MDQAQCRLPDLRQRRFPERRHRSAAGGDSDNDVVDFHYRKNVCVVRNGVFAGVLWKMGVFVMVFCGVVVVSLWCFCGF